MTKPVLARPARHGEPGYNPYGRSGRVYEHPLTGEIAPSITAVQGVIDKPAVDNHNLKKVAEYAYDHLSELLSVSAGDISRDDIIKDLTSKPFERTPESPSSIGDLVHEAIDAYAKQQAFAPKGQRFLPDDAPLTARRMWKQFLAFADKYQPEFTHTEFTVWSHKHNYAGTADWAAKIAGWHVLGDTKSGKKAYPDVGIQVSAINGADTILTPVHDDLHNGEQVWLERPMFKADRFAALHIRPTYAVLLPILHIEECFETFLAARKIHEWQFSVAPNVLGEAPRVSVPMRETA
jgi:hypothetical protein